MRRERLKVVGVEAVGPYRLVRIARGGLEPGAPGQFFMLRPPGHVLPRPDEPLPGAAGRARVPRRRRRAGNEGAGPQASRARLRRPRARSATATGSTSQRPLLVGGGVGIAPLPYLAEQPPGAPAVRRLPKRRGTRRRPPLLPGAEVVVEPPLRHRGDPTRLRCPRLRPRADAPTPSPRSHPAPARLGGSDGVRLRRLLRLRRSRSTAGLSASASKARSSPATSRARARTAARRGRAA